MGRGVEGDDHNHIDLRLFSTRRLRFPQLYPVISPPTNQNKVQELITHPMTLYPITKFTNHCLKSIEVFGSFEHELLFSLLPKSHQSCLTLCDPIDGSPPGSSVPGILQARALEWVAISFSNAWKWHPANKSWLRHKYLLSEFDFLCCRHRKPCLVILPLEQIERVSCFFCFCFFFPKDPDSNMPWKDSAAIILPY